MDFRHAIDGLSVASVCVKITYTYEEHEFQATTVWKAEHHFWTRAMTRSACDPKHFNVGKLGFSNVFGRQWSSGVSISTLSSLA